MSRDATFRDAWLDSDSSASQPPCPSCVIADWRCSTWPGTVDDAVLLPDTEPGGDAEEPLL